MSVKGQVAPGVGLALYSVHQESQTQCLWEDVHGEDVPAACERTLWLLTRAHASALSPESPGCLLVSSRECTFRVASCRGGHFRTFCWGWGWCWCWLQAPPKPKLTQSNKCDGEGRGGNNSEFDQILRPAVFDQGSAPRGQSHSRPAWCAPPQGAFLWQQSQVLGDPGPKTDLSWNCKPSVPHPCSGVKSPPHHLWSYKNAASWTSQTCKVPTVPSSCRHVSLGYVPRSGIAAYGLNPFSSPLHDVKLFFCSSCTNLHSTSSIGEICCSSSLLGLGIGGLKILPIALLLYVGIIILKWRSRAGGRVWFRFISFGNEWCSPRLSKKATMLWYQKK